ncbi:NAD(P)/FAD-dependent oxidoreductase [Burkholderia pseudomallei]|uniref:NAD(P)/FAD-dependent oxidoreductase n=1 Tax=Burkholderia pseudomallei TaxID=28450 RepID=UPI001AD70827|nr:FAD-binding oxidoreductase [Burkholderia pseudomallei]MBO7795464.1 FAD-binding oxidoreductase [Burkholderia pseudomallei]MBO7814017.1 FAD-binding oxidoreductase [Burkholderia pseudomallei]
MTPTTDVVVIGGGLIGCSTALHLARRGITVRVIEKDYVARHASGVNAGGVRTLGRALPELPLSIAAKRLWRSLPDLVGSDGGFKAVGQIRVAENEEQLERLRTRSHTVAALGLDYRERVIKADELYERLPALAPHCVGGLLVEDDGYALPYPTTLAFQRQAERCGALIHQGVTAAIPTYAQGQWRVRTSDGACYRARTLVNAAGAWGGRLAAALGDVVPLQPNGSMLMVTARMAPFVGPVVGSAGRSLSFKQFPNGTVLIGGGHRAAVDLDTNGTSLALEGLARAARTAIDLFPVMRTARAVRFWSGIEGFLPDGLPVIGPSGGSPSAFHAFGFSAHGFQLGPIVGQLLAELISEGHASLPIEAFRVDRFDEASAREEGGATAPPGMTGAAA